MIMLHPPEYRSKWMDNYANPLPNWTGGEQTNIRKYKKKKITLKHPCPEEGLTGCCELTERKVCEIKNARLRKK